jgi:hypothetical protein
MVNIEIDKLTNSIINAVTGDVFDTDVLVATSQDLKATKKEWHFDWEKELKKGKVYKLVIEGNSNVVQGLLSLIDQKDNIYVSLVENAPYNIGANKVYEGVAGNLFAFACKVAFEQGYEGYISFHAKTELVEHYMKSLGAKCINAQLMYVDTREATILVNRYFKNFEI